MFGEHVAPYLVTNTGWACSSDTLCRARQEACMSVVAFTVGLCRCPTGIAASRHRPLVESSRSNASLVRAGVLRNFEKFLIAPGGAVANRFRPRTLPDAPEVVAAIEAVLPN
ncbi:MAG TPA: hypothetical protein VEF72_03645 [Mycobacterium sp.]|nr:hypothetical protein [Mycobacterium sp.]